MDISFMPSSEPLYLHPTPLLSLLQLICYSLSCEFVDNVFNSPYDHALSICELLAKLKLRVSLQSLELNPLFIDDTLITAMERAGFSGIGITVESASDSVLDGLGKGFTAGHVYKAAEVIKRHKITLCLDIHAGRAE